MSTDNKTKKNSHAAQVHWDEKGLPYSTRFDDIYFSKDDGIAESRYVFLDANRLKERWDQHSIDSTFSIGETGFGTGLNFLLAWQLWNKHDHNKNAQLHFISVEKYPLSKNDLTKALALWPELSALSQKLINAYPPQPLQGIHRLNFYDDNISLTLSFGDAAEGFQQLAPISKAGPHVSSSPCAIGSLRPQIDAWFLDGFAPSKNPEMWKDALFSAIKNLSGRSTTFATFTAASAVRKQLIAIGFECQKIKGFGRKREMLIGKFSVEEKQKGRKPEVDEQTTPTHFRDHKHQKIDAEPSWHLNRFSSNKKVEHCIVIGGGLAGCHTAFALAKKNIRVTLLEKNNTLAMEASGNRQGVVYAKLSPHNSPLNTFNLAALLYASQFYHSLGLYEKCGDACGVLHLAINDNLRTQYQAFCETFRESPDFSRWLTTEECEAVSGVPSTFPALYLPQTGWLSPAPLCLELVKSERIEVRTESKVSGLQNDGNQWEVTYTNKANSTETVYADAVVLANAHAASEIEQSQHLPLKKIRGQVSHIPSTTSSKELRKVICGDGYISPALNNCHSLGATFNLHEYGTGLTARDHRQNLDKLTSLSPALTSNIDTSLALDGKVGFRCTTPDYFPIVGSIADYSSMKERFAFYRKKANATIDNYGAYHHHLYANLGHGARGLCYIPLASEVLASAIAGQVLPISRDLYRHMAPGRFIIRDLMRNKI